MPKWIDLKVQLKNLPDYEIKKDARFFLKTVRALVEECKSEQEAADFMNIDKMVIYRALRYEKNFLPKTNKIREKCKLKPLVHKIKRPKVKRTKKTKTFEKKNACPNCKSAFVEYSTTGTLHHWTLRFCQQAITYCPYCGTNLKFWKWQENEQ